MKIFGIVKQLEEVSADGRRLTIATVDVPGLDKRIRICLPRDSAVSFGGLRKPVRDLRLGDDVPLACPDDFAEWSLWLFMDGDIFGIAVDPGTVHVSGLTLS